MSRDLNLLPDLAKLSKVALGSSISNNHFIAFSLRPEAHAMMFWVWTFQFLKRAGDGKGVSLMDEASFSELILSNALRYFLSFLALPSRPDSSPSPDVGSSESLEDEDPSSPPSPPSPLPRFFRCVRAGSEDSPGQPSPKPPEPKSPEPPGPLPPEGAAANVAVLVADEAVNAMKPGPVVELEPGAGGSKPPGATEVCACAVDGTLSVGNVGAGRA